MQCFSQVSDGFIANYYASPDTNTNRKCLKTHYLLVIHVVISKPKCGLLKYQLTSLKKKCTVCLLSLRDSVLRNEM